MRRTRPKAFTIIELMIVISVMLVLVGLVLVVLQGNVDSTRAKSTRVTLANCVSLMTAMDANVKTDELRASLGIGPTVDALPSNQPLVVSQGAPGRVGTEIANTARMFVSFARLPESKNVLGAAGAGTMPVPGVANSAVPLDAWRNPVLFVPGGGLLRVRRANATATVTAPNGRAFFASAGADGDFSKGDDNIYSFEAQ